MDGVDSSIEPLRPPSEASEEGAAIAAAIAGRWLHPEAELVVTVDPLPRSPEAAPFNAAPHTLSDGMYVHFLSRDQSTGPTPLPPRVPRSMFASSLPWCLQWPLFFSGYVADSHVQRGTAAIFLVLCIIGIVWRNHNWYWYVLYGTTADAGFRVMGGDRLAVLSTIAEIGTTFVPGSRPIAAAPRQFTWIFYTAMNLASAMVTGMIINGDSNHVALATLLGIQAAFHALELVGISLPELLFERVLVRRGWISDLYRHKAEAWHAQLQLKMASSKAKMQHSPAQHTVVVTSSTTGASLLRLEALTLAARTQFDPIRNLSVGYAFPLLGVAGLADLFYYGNQLVGISEWAWYTLAVVLGMLYISFWGVQLARLYLVPKVVLRELSHPHLRYTFMLFFAIPLLSIDFMLSVDVTYCKVVLWMFGPLVAAVVLVFVRDWVQHPLQFEILNASWLVAIIVLIIVAFELPQVYPDLAELAWLWLAFGLFMWAMLAALILVRLFFTAALPDSQRPTLFLLISTAAISTAAIIFQDPQAVQLTGPLSTLAEFFFWMTNFLSFICYFLLLNGYFCRSPFNMSYWAISFPSAALALVWLLYYQIGNCDTASPSTQYSSEERCTNNQDSDTIRGIVILTYVNAAVGNSILAVNTVLAAIQRRLFLPVPQWSPALLLQLHHLAFRTALYKTCTWLGEVKDQQSGSEENGSTVPAAGPVVASLYHSLQQAPLVALGELCPCSMCQALDPVGPQQLMQDSLEMLVMLELSFTNYLKLKQEILWPTLRRWLPHVNFLHMQDGTAAGDIRRQLHSIIAAMAALIPSTGSPRSSSSSDQHTALHVVHQRAVAVARTIHIHLDHEETSLTALLHHFTDLPSASSLMRDVWHAMDMDTKRVLVPWIINVLPDHQQRMSFIDCVGWATPEALVWLGRWLDGVIDPFLYCQLCVDYPVLKSHHASPHAKFW